MGGRIWVESEVGRGSRFHFIVRLDLADSEPAEPLPPSRRVCMGCGCSSSTITPPTAASSTRSSAVGTWCPTTAPSAAEAIRLLREARQKGEPYRLVLTDAHMPGMDGFMLAEQIKQDSAAGQHGGHDADLGRPPGRHATLRTNWESPPTCSSRSSNRNSWKPSNWRWASRFPGRTAARTAAPPQHVGNLHILLAEDSLVNQKLAVALLEGQGHTVRLVNNGREAIAALQTEKFDMVLMDVQMPEMDGLEASEKIRAQEQHTGRHVPIIAMTAHALKGDRERCLAPGWTTTLPNRSVPKNSSRRSTPFSPIARTTRPPAPQFPRMS